MSECWHYQINGFESGPVPPSEIRRLLLKGRLAPGTPVRREGCDRWSHAEHAAGEVPCANPDQVAGPTRKSEPWHLTLLHRYAAFGVPIGVGLAMLWGRAGQLVLTPFAVALILVLVGIARDLRAIREAIGRAPGSGRDRPGEGGWL